MRYLPLALVAILMLAGSASASIGPDGKMLDGGYVATVPGGPSGPVLWIISGGGTVLKWYYDGEHQATYTLVEGTARTFQDNYMRLELHGPIGASSGTHDMRCAGHPVWLGGSWGG